MFNTLAELDHACRHLPDGDIAAAECVAQRQAVLTKPPGSLGRLETLVAWLAEWQHRPVPRLDHVRVLVFAGNHGVTRQGVSPYPPDVTHQMVANFAAGGAAINALSKQAGAELRVLPLYLDQPTQDFTEQPAMDEQAFLRAVNAGADAVDRDTDLLCLGEMGIGNTTAAAAICAALYGGGGARWAGRGTGVDDAGLHRKQTAIDTALHRHADTIGQPLRIAAALGGYELAAILGATVAARQYQIPVLLDGFVCTAAVAPLAVLRRHALNHCCLAHVSAESGHQLLAQELRLRPLLDLEMRLGEASGAALAVNILRGALACHIGMASFTEAGVSNAG